jgi:hypothetical protein
MMSPEKQMQPRQAANSRELSPGTGAEIDLRLSPQMQTASLLQQARQKPRSLTHANVLQLQRGLGNRAVVKLLARTTQGDATAGKPISQPESIELADKNDISLQHSFETVQRFIEFDDNGQDKFRENRQPPLSFIPLNGYWVRFNPDLSHDANFIASVSNPDGAG